MSQRRKHRLRRAARNARGRAAGYGGCLRCGDSWSWKPSHTTYYGNAQAQPSKDHPSPEIVASKGCFPLCEECWSSLTIRQRLPYYETLVDMWGGNAGARAMLYSKAFGVSGPHAKQRRQIREAVLAGG